MMRVEDTFFRGIGMLPRPTPMRSKCVNYVESTDPMDFTVRVQPTPPYPFVCRDTVVAMQWNTR